MCDLVNNTQAFCTTVPINNFYWNIQGLKHYPNTVPRTPYLLARLKIDLDGFSHIIPYFKITEDPTFKEWEENRPHDPKKSTIHFEVSESCYKNSYSGLLKVTRKP